MKKYREDVKIASDLNGQKSSLLIQNLFNLMHIDCYKLTGVKLNDTDYRYDIYVKNGKKITNGQQLFINGFIAGLNSVL